MIDDFDEGELAAARRSRSGAVAKNWTREDIEKHIESKQIRSIDMLSDYSLYVAFTLVPSDVGPRGNIGVEDDFIVDTSAVAYKDFLELSGLKEPGQHKYFRMPNTSSQRE